MRFVDKADLLGTDRDVTHANYRTTRLLIAADDAGVGLTDITLEPGIEDTYGYDDRTEIAYCISGDATVRDLSSGEVREIGPGVLWVAPPGSRFTFVARVPTRLVCIFDPPLEGSETGVIEATG
jgi:L-ectoine synthase